jgi:hypothetical protein
VALVVVVVVIDRPVVEILVGVFVVQADHRLLHVPYEPGRRADFKPETVLLLSRRQREVIRDAGDVVIIETPQRC